MILNQQTALSKVFEKDEVVPDVIDKFDISAILQISYGDKEVHYGNELLVSETQSIPKINVAVTKFATEYTLVLTDPDAPRRGDKKWSEFAHYIVTNLKLDSSKLGEPQPLPIESGVELLKYMGPGPPEKTGKHRYVFILYEGTLSKTVSDRPNFGLNRPGAGVRDFVKLKPVGMNYFMAQNEIQ